MIPTQEILDTICQFYPKNISLDDVDAYDKSPEYLNRVKRCQEARESHSNWIKFKDELKNLSLEESNNSISDYSVLGSEPCYSVSLYIGVDGQQSLLSILISVIIPLWTYRFIEDDSVRYSCKNNIEENFLLVLKPLIEKHFPIYSHIKEDQHQLIVSDIDTVFESGPTIFEAIFKLDWN